MQPSDDAVLLRTLAHRLATAPLLVGTMPDELPITLPLPPGACVLGSVVQPGLRHPTDPDVEWAPGHSNVYLDAPSTAAELAAFYTQACEELGWTILRAGGARQPAASVTLPLPLQISVIAQGPDGRYVRW